MLTLFSAPLLVGGALDWTVPLTSVLAVTTLVFLLFEGHAPTTLPPALTVAILALVWVGLQAAPLPCGVVEAVAPLSSQQAQAAVAMLDGPPATCTVSRDPGGTYEALVRDVGTVATLLCGFLLARLREHLFVVGVVGLVGVTIAAIGLAHGVADADLLYGVYAPQHANPILLAPLLNANNQAGLMLLSLPCLVACAVRDEQRRTLWIAAGVTAAAVCLLSISRGGIAVLVIEAGLLGLWLWRTSTSKGRAATRAWLIVAVPLVGALAVASYSAVELLQASYLPTGLSKVDHIWQAFLFAGEQPLVGAGRGAYAASFVQRYGTTTRALHAENLVAQWVADFGLPVAVALFAAFGAATIRAARRMKGPVQSAAVLGIAAVVLQNQLDFGLELAGLALPAAALMGVVVAVGRGSASETEPRPRNRRRFTWRTSVAAMLVIVAFVGPGIPGNSVHTLQVELQREGVDDAEFERRLAHAVRLHPSEPAFALIAGARAVERDESAALRWLNRCMELAPGWSSPHEQAALFLLRRGRVAQAILEIREAGRRHWPRATGLACELAKEIDDARPLLEAAPDTPSERASFFETVANCAPLDTALGQQSDALLHEEDPTLLGPQLRASQRLRAAGDASGAVQMLRSVVDERPTHGVAARLLATWLAEDGDLEESRAILGVAEASASDMRPFLVTRARVEAYAHQDSAMRHALRRLRGMSAGSSSRLASAYLLEADLELQLGHPELALNAWRSSLRFDERPGTLRRIAEASESSGNMRSAYQAWMRLCRVDPTATDACERRRRLLDTSVNAPGSTGN